MLEVILYVSVIVSVFIAGAYTYSSGVKQGKSISGYQPNGNQPIPKQLPTTGTSVYNPKLCDMNVCPQCKNNVCWKAPMEYMRRGELYVRVSDAATDKCPLCGLDDVDMEIHT